MVCWGIASAGMISEDFANALKFVKDAQLVAVAAREKEKADKFISKLKLEQAKGYGSYEELAADPKVEVVYVGSIHPTHKDITLMMLNAGKHVLVEKPIEINREKAQEMVNLAREKKLFLMEAMWTRCFPAMKKVRELLEAKAIGEVRIVQVHLGVVVDEENQERLTNPKLGGGGLLDIGVYVIGHASLGFSAEKPQEVQTTALMTDTGVDKAGGIVIRYQNGLAIVSYAINASSPEELHIVGSKGRITVKACAHTPEHVVLYKESGEGKPSEEKFDFPLPDPGSIEFNYPNSIGLKYEAEEVHRCLEKGLLECPLYPLTETLIIMGIIDQVKSQIELEYPHEKKKS